MSDKPKRPWFRFHLLTAVLMMISAGGMLGLDLRERDGPPGWWTSRYGWPLDAAERWNMYSYHGPAGLEDPDPLRLRWKLAGVGADCATAIVLLAAVACVSEYLIRRREGRKP